MTDNQGLLESILAAQIALLAREIRREREAKGVRSTGNYYREAVRELARERGSILRTVGESG